MRKTKFHKWSRLLFAGFIAIMMALSFAPSVAMAADCDDCVPCPECEDGCKLQVNIVMPTNNAQVNVGDYFWVNATVAKPAECGSIENVMVEVTYNECAVDLSWDSCAVQGPFELSNCFDVRDFWWKFKCKDDEPAQIKVRAWVPDSEIREDCDTVTVIQKAEGCDKLEVCIIECPEGPIMPCTTFAVKALVKNMTEYETMDAVGSISFTGPASLVGCVPEWEINDLRPGGAQEVGWTLHCDGGGAVNVAINAIADFDKCQRWECAASDTCIVEQICEANLSASLTAPEKVGQCCDNCFDVVLNYNNTCNIVAGIEDLCAYIHVGGDAHVDGGSLNVGLPDLGPSESGSYTWTVCCDGEESAEIYVDMCGYDPVNNKQITYTTSTVVVEQKFPLMVEMLGPMDMTKYTTGQQFEVTYRLTNTRDSGTELQNILTGIALGSGINPCVELASPTVKLIPDPNSGVTEPIYLTAYAVEGTCWQEILIDCLCDCEYFDVVWTVQCCCSGMCDVDLDNGACGGDCTLKCPDVIEAYARLNPESLDWEDYDSVQVQQMTPPCLKASIDAFEGSLYSGDFDGQDTIKRSDCMAIVPGDYFTVVVPVANTGEATAEDVMVSISFVGPAELVGEAQSLTQDLGDIGCHQSDKAVWEFLCTGDGEVRFNITSLSGYDANYGEQEMAISCIDTGCPIWIDQIPLDIEIIQPLTCTSFIEGDTFTVKAKITNNDEDHDLENVWAKLYWKGVDNGFFGDYKYGGGDMELASGQSNPISIGDLIAGEWAEVTWQSIAEEDGDVKFWVKVWNEGCCDCETKSPSIKTYSDPEIIHFYDPGHICCYIVSPKFKDYDDCCEYGEPAAMIGTGQQYSVTAKMFNSGDRPFTIDEVMLMDDWCWDNDGNVEIIGGPYFVWPDPSNPYVLEKKQTAMVSWDLVCTDPGKTDIKVKVSGHDDMNTLDSCWSWVTVLQYDAANLVVDIIDYPAEDIQVGDTFDVTARVCNVGGADAWEPYAQLSVYPDGSALITSGSYTQSLGAALNGHGFDECEEVTWTLRCMQAGSSTITVTATGNDEYGYEVKQICDSEIYGDQITCCELVLHGTPGVPIRQPFLYPDSITVNQVEDDPASPSGDNFDIQLSAGWNLISLPWYIMPGDPRLPENVLADILDNLICAYGYNACDFSFPSYNPDPLVPDFLSSMRDGPGFWLYMENPDVLSVLAPDFGSGTPVVPQYTNQCTGYNLIGPRIGEQEDTFTVADWLGAKPVSAVVGWDNESGTFYILTSQSYVQPGVGYFVFFDGICTRGY